MPIAFHDHRRLLFMHIPKTGGTSVEKYLEQRFGPLAWLDSRWMQHVRRDGLRQGLRVSPQHLAAADIEQLAPGPWHWCFAVVRDPVARVVSQFRFSADLGDPLTRLGFSLWLRVVLAAARRDPTIYDNHLRPQVDFLPPDCEVFHLEQGLERVVQRIDAITGTTAPGLAVPHALRSKGTAVQPSAADRALIARHYAADYARLGYPAPAAGGGLRTLLGPPQALAAGALAPLAQWRWQRGKSFPAA